MEGADELMGDAGGPFSLSVADCAARYRGRRGEEEFLGTALWTAEYSLGVL
jgi:hypothetical protein